MNLNESIVKIKESDIIDHFDDMNAKIERSIEFTKTVAGGVLS